jgi:cytochrome c oxidase cbb3-type subunit 3
MSKPLILCLSLALLGGCQPAEEAAVAESTSASTAAAPAAASAGSTETPEQRAARLQATFPAQQRAPADPALVAQGADIYGVNCRACHGQDLRGGDLGGPNLLRSTIVLQDQEGELIGAVVREGRSNPGNTVMPALPLDDTETKAVAAYIHSITASARGQGAPPAEAATPINIVVGDAAAGATLFQAQCSSCHDAAGDLAGIATRIPSAEDLQNSWVAGRDWTSPPDPQDPARAVRATVTLDNGETISGRLQRQDDFVLSLRTDDGRHRSFTLQRGTPGLRSVQIEDPLARHLELLSQLDDDTMHNITAYLVTLK